MGRRELGVDICQSPIWLKPASMLRRQGIHAAQIAAPRAPSKFWRVPREARSQELRQPAKSYSSAPDCLGPLAYIHLAPVGLHRERA